MASFVLSLVLCVAGITVVVRIVAGMRKPPSRADRYLTDTILTLLLAVALQVRTVRADFDAWAGWNVTWPTQHALVMLSAWWALNYLVHATSTDSSRLRGFIRRHALVSGLTIVATIAAFAAEPTAPDFWYGPAGRIEGGGEVNAAGVVAFMVYGLYMTGSMALQAVHTVRWVRRAHVRWLGIGLGVIACGLVCGFAFGVDTAGF
ncbi:MAG: hypothetical protein J2P17_04775, partial [Mycobacterium sp.]|nr:hypothetical protein [Mycobacterium sp.]